MEAGEGEGGGQDTREQADKRFSGVVRYWREAVESGIRSEPEAHHGIVPFDTLFAPILWGSRAYLM